nr:unnamed protein product [Digitaria exilis]
MDSRRLTGWDVNHGSGCGRAGSAAGARGGVSGLQQESCPGDHLQMWFLENKLNYCPPCRPTGPRYDM